MNKLFTKIAGAVLGLTLTIGVGFGIGSNKEAIPVSAASGDTFSFTAASGDSTDGIWSYSTAKNSSGTTPAYNTNSAELRLYYASNGSGGSVTIKVKNSSQNLITAISFTASSTSYTPSINYFEDDSASGTAHAGTWSSTKTSYTPASGVAAITLQNANTSNKQLRLKSVTVTYSTVTVSANLVSITATSTQTEVHQGQPLDEDQITVTGHYDDDKDRPIVTGWNVDFDSSVVGTGKVATVTYVDENEKEFSDTFTVNVIEMPAELDVTISNFTEISTSYGNYSHTYTGLNDLNGGTTGSVTIYVNQAYKNANGIQMTKEKNCHINNTTAFPGRILSVTATFTASGRNTTTMYASYGSAATASSTKIGDGSNSVTEQVFDFSDGNYNYFYFDLSNVTGAVYYSLHIEYGKLTPEVTSTTYEETIYTSNNGGAATSFVATLTYSNFTSVEDVNVISSNTSIIPVANCVLSNSNTTLTVTGNAVAGSSTITVEAMDSDTEVYTCEIEVTVVNNSSSVSKIEVTTQPTKTSYTEGDALDLTGVVVTATYSDETTVDVTEECTFSPADGAILSLTDTTVSVSYTFSGKTVNASFNLTISEMPRYTLVTDITQLTEGSKVLLAGVNSETTYVAQKYASGNNVKAVEATLDGEKVIKASEMSAMTIGTDSNGYTIKDEGDKYLYAASSSGNQMKGQASASINAYWNITYSEGAFSITAHKSENRNVMQFNYNNGSPIFSCYASDSQSAVQLYVLDTDPSAADKLNTFGRLFLNSVENTLVTEETGVQGTACVDDGTYLAAKSALAGAWFCVKSDLQNDTTGLALRYEAWARAAGDADPYDGNSNIQSTIRNQLIALTENNNIAILIIVIASSMTLIAGVIVFKRKKNQLSK